MRDTEVRVKLTIDTSDFDRQLSRASWAVREVAADGSTSGSFGRFRGLVEGSRALATRIAGEWWPEVFPVDVEPKSNGAAVRVAVRLDLNVFFQHGRDSARDNALSLAEQLEIIAAAIRQQAGG